WIVGSSAPDARRFQPIAMPAGTPTKMAHTNPLATRSRENVRLASQVPLYALKPSPTGPKAQTVQAFHTRFGDGSTPSNSAPSLAATCHRMTTANGRQIASNACPANIETRVDSAP